MILELTLKKDERTGKILAESAPIDMNKECKARTGQVMEEFGRAYQLRNKPYREFNNVSLVERQNRDTLSWNQYVEPPSEDPAQSWRCVSADTEILGVDGWKKMGELKKGDAVFSYDLETGQVMHDEVRNAFQYDVDGEMVHIKNKHTDQLVTPNHRVISKEFKRQLFNDVKLKDKRKRFWEEKYRYVEAQNLSRGCIDYRLPLAGSYDGAFSIGEDWAELVGWMLTDGCMPDKPGGGGYITQSKPLTLIKIRSLLVSMGVEFREWSRPKVTKGKKCFDEHRFYFPTHGAVMNVMYKLIPGRKPTNQLWHLPLNEKRRLFEGLCYGDGTKSGAEEYTAICKPWQDFREWSQTFVHLMGIRSVPSDMRTNLGYKDSADIVGKKHIKTVAYKGKVWSVETGRTNYIARRNGFIFITGNSTAFRPIVRNKAMAIAAHVTASVIYPLIYAQNEQDKLDNDAATVMRDLTEWASEQSKYERVFISAVINALVYPVSILHTEYAEVMKKVKREVDGKIEEKEEVDEVMSGFQDRAINPLELYIANFYENDIQKQPFLIWRKVIDYSTAQTKYAGNKRFDKYVRPGVQYLYSNDDGNFYRLWDEELRGELVEEVIYYNRTADLQLVFVNGILISDVDQMNPREDKLYPFAKSGYELINEKFFYYKSLAFKLANDEEIVNTAYRMLTDGTYLQIMPPAVLFGANEINSAIIAPGMVTAISDPQPNASFQTIQTNNNLSSAFNLLQKVEGSISESSADNLQSGMAQGGGGQTAYEISRLEQNARVMLGIFGKMIGYLVQDFGKLRVSDVCQFLTVGEASEIISGDSQLTFRKFVLPEKESKGKRRTRRIEFTSELPDEMTDEQVMEESMKVAKDEFEEDVEIFKVNPTLFRKLKFMIKVTAEAVLPKSDALKRAIQLEQYALAMANPLLNHEAITRDLLLASFDKTSGDVEKYMKKEQPQTGGMQGLESQLMGGKPDVDGLQSAEMATEAQPDMKNLAGTL